MIECHEGQGYAQALPGEHNWSSILLFELTLVSE